MLTPAIPAGSGAPASPRRVKRPQPRNGLYRTVAIFTTFAMVFGGLLLMPMAATAASATTTTRLNLRTGPGLGNEVITVIPEGAAISVDGDLENGYYPVTYDGTSGYASSDYITFGGNAGSDSDDGAPVSGGAPVGTAWVDTGRLNFRTGPSLGDSVISVLSSGDAVELTGQQANGYCQATVNGTTGWLAADYLTTSGAPSNPDPDPQPEPDAGNAGDSVPVGDTVTGSAVVTAGLNLRRGPSTDYDIVAVMPSGASVELRGDPQGGYVPLSYDGATGWAHGDWLDVGGSSPAPDPESDTGNGSGPVPVGDTVTGSATVTAGLNLRSGPSTSYGVITVMPEGATVELRGEPQGGYVPLSYNGTTGWAHGDWLETGGANPAPEPEPDPDTGATPQFLYTTESVSMRSSPSSGGSLVWQIPPNTRVTVTGAPENGYYPAAWAHVSGWLDGDSLATSYDGPPSGNEEIIAIIHEAADFYGQPREDMVRVAECESHFNPNAVNPISGTSGLFQFRPSTWATTPFADEDIFDARANAYAAAWMWSVGRRNEWACQ